MGISSEESARRIAAIHQVDSVFGILLAASIPSANLYYSASQRFSGPQLPFSLQVTLTVGLVAASVLLGMHGILKQNWTSKLLGWYSATLLILISFARMAYEVAYSTGLQVPPWYPLVSFPTSCAALLLSYLPVSRWVIGAYVQRILLVGSQDQALELAKTQWFQSFLPGILIAII